MHFRISACFYCVALSTATAIATYQWSMHLIFAKLQDKQIIDFQFVQTIVFLVSGQNEMMLITHVSTLTLQTDIYIIYPQNIGG